MKYFGDVYLELQDRIARLSKDEKLELATMYGIQPLTHKENSFLFGDPIKGLLFAIKQMKVNRLVYGIEDEDEREKIKKKLREKGWTFVEDSNINDVKELSMFK